MIIPKLDKMHKFNKYMIYVQTDVCLPLLPHTLHGHLGYLWAFTKKGTSVV